MVGAVASRLIDTLTGPLLPPALVAEQLYVTACWSAVIDWSSQPVFWRLFGDSGSLTVQVNVTSDVYQSFCPSGVAGFRT
jgi:hypothetical protein